MPKKNKEERLYIDFMELNKNTIIDKYPLLLIKALLHQIQDSMWFITIDLCSGYWQFLLERNSKKYTVFYCTKSLFQLKILPFGFTNAPSSF